MQKQGESQILGRTEGIKKLCGPDLGFVVKTTKMNKDVI